MTSPAAIATRAEWTADFTLELQRLRPTLTGDLAAAIAAHQWSGSGGVPPSDAARRYHGKHPMPRSSARRTPA